MSYAIGSGEALAEGLVRAIAEQVAKLRDECGAARENPAAFVHKARVRCKRIRAALRLLRPALGDKLYRRQNAWWRDAARGLSEIRDMTAKLEALNAIAPELENDVDGAVLRRLRWQFDRERADFELAIAGHDPIGRFCETIAGVDPVVLSDLDGYHEKQLGHGLRRTYDKARNAMAAAFEGGSPEEFHEWRKQTKYHALQLRLVRHLLPAAEARIQAARDLALLLGGVQDIEVVTSGLTASASDQRIHAALEAQRAAMIRGAYVAGEALFLDKPRHWAREALDSPVEVPDAEPAAGQA